VKAYHSSERRQVCGRFFVIGLFLSPTVNIGRYDAGVNDELSADQYTRA
jgi:hypothetical protein